MHVGYPQSAVSASLSNTRKGKGMIKNLNLKKTKSISVLDPIIQELNQTLVYVKALHSSPSIDCKADLQLVLEAVQAAARQVELYINYLMLKENDN